MYQCVCVCVSMHASPHPTICVCMYKTLRQITATSNIFPSLLIHYIHALKHLHKNFPENSLTDNNTDIHIHQNPHCPSNAHGFSSKNSGILEATINSGTEVSTREQENSP